MEKGQIKKLYLFYILRILERYSDLDHGLSQAEIIEKVKEDYGMSCERKAIARNIGDLRDLGYEIEHSRQGYYLSERTFEDSELRLLIDSVLASRYVPKKQARDLVKKLTEQSSIYFKKRVRHTANIENMVRDSANQLFLTIEDIGRAIEEKKQIAFYYNKYGPDKRLHHTTSEKHVVNPYQIVIANGRYYLISNIDKYDNVTHFRVERIAEIEVLGTPCKAQSRVTELEKGLDLPKHMVEHLYMFSGKSSRITLRVKPQGINDVIDWLGRDVEVTPDGEQFLVSVTANESALKYWALQFGMSVEVVKPAYLREEVKQMIKEINSKYEEKSE